MGCYKRWEKTRNSPSARDKVKDETGGHQRMAMGKVRGGNSDTFRGALNPEKGGERKLTAGKRVEKREAN